MNVAKAEIITEDKDDVWLGRIGNPISPKNMTDVRRTRRGFIWFASSVSFSWFSRFLCRVWASTHRRAFAKQ